MSGGRKETVDDREILAFFEESDDPFLFTGEVAEQFGFSNTGMIKRLRSLHDDGLLESKKSGKVPGWWLSEEGREFLNGEVDPSGISEPE